MKLTLAILPLLLCAVLGGLILHEAPDICIFWLLLTAAGAAVIGLLVWLIWGIQYIEQRYYNSHQC